MRLRGYFADLHTTGNHLPDVPLDILGLIFDYAEEPIVDVSDFLYDLIKAENSAGLCNISVMTLADLQAALYIHNALSPNTLHMYREFHNPHVSDDVVFKFWHVVRDNLPPLAPAILYAYTSIPRSVSNEIEMDMIYNYPRGHASSAFNVQEAAVALRILRDRRRELKRQGLWKRGTDPTDLIGDAYNFVLTVLEDHSISHFA